MKIRDIIDSTIEYVSSTSEAGKVVSIFSQKLFSLVNINPLLLNKYITFKEEYPEIKGIDDVIVDDIKIKLVKKNDGYEKLKDFLYEIKGKTTAEIFTLANNLGYTDLLDLLDISGTIKIKSPLLDKDEEEFRFELSVGKQLLTYIDENKDIDYKYDVYYPDRMETSRDVSGINNTPFLFDEYNIQEDYHSNNGNRGKILKANILKKVDTEIQEFIKKIDINYLLEDHNFSIDSSYSDLPSYKSLKNDEIDLEKGIKKGRINSKFLYDNNGGNLYSEMITKSDYKELNNKEFELLEKYSDKLTKYLNTNLLDIGAGDGFKAEKFINTVLGDTEKTHNYYGLDSSVRMLVNFSHKLNNVSENINIVNQSVDFSDLSCFKNLKEKTFLLFGSSVSNFELSEQTSFFKNIESSLGDDDIFIVSLFTEQEEEFIKKVYDNKESKNFVFNLFNGFGLDDNDINYNVEFDKTTQTAEKTVVFKRDTVFEVNGKKVKKLKGDKIIVNKSKRFSKDYILDLLQLSGLELIEDFHVDGYGLFVIKKRKEEVNITLKNELVTA